MTIPSTLRVTELDFDQIKTNLKTFLSTKEEFQDFNFEAAGINVLVDLMAYNTHYNAVIANFLANEMFLDTAAKRSSVVSHAKALGYRPRGLTSARATINLTVTDIVSDLAAPPSIFVIPRGTPFITSIGNSEYQFVTTTNYFAPNVGTNEAPRYEFTNMVLIEGYLLSYEWVVTDDTTGTRYPIPNPYIDVSSITLQVRNAATDVNVFETWAASTSVLTLDETSKVYWTQEQKDGMYEIFFGSGQIGAKPSIGNLITAQYVVSRGVLGNGADTFIPLGTISNNGSGQTLISAYTIQTVTPSQGGSDPETIDEIRHNAANNYITQNRAVTLDDYRNLISSYFPTKAIKVWGGEDNVPAKYGKVIVCIQPQYGDVITEIEKKSIASFISSKSVVSVGLEFVDPEYTYVNVDTSVFYNPNKLPGSLNLSVAVATTIVNYSRLVLEKFGSDILMSKFQTEIDDTHESIRSNTTVLSLYKKFYPKLGLPLSYQLKFGNAIKKQDGAVTTSQFKVMEDTTQYMSIRNKGQDLYLVTVDSVGNTQYRNTVGSVDFSTGQINIDDLHVVSVLGSEIRVTVLPESDDVVGGLNSIIKIEPSSIRVTTVPTSR